MSTFYEVLEQIRKESQTQQSKGTKFERLMRNYLKTSSRFVQILQEVWLWKEFPYKKELGSIDTGIDIVAMTIDGEYWAIQCKCYADGTLIDKPAVDSFLSTSSREFKADGKVCGFGQRIWISTTEKWGRNAEEAIKNQNPPVHIITSTNIAEDNTVDWEKLLKGKKGKDASCKNLHDPKPWQSEALEKAHDYFQTHDRGKLIMACGTGKTFTSLRLVEQETASMGLILVMVPSIALINQTLNEWSNQSVKDIRAICVCSDSTASKRKSNNLDDLVETSEDLALPACTDARSVARQIYDSCVDAEGMVVVFSTYQSIDVISKAQQILMGTAPKTELSLFGDEIKPGDYSFDFIICDEAHRTTGATLMGTDESAFVRIHDNNYIKADKRLYMTATPRLYGDSAKKKAEEKDIILCSMDDEELYGKEIYRIGFGRAVELGALSDYKVLVLTLRDDTPLPSDVLSAIQDENQEINTDDAVKMVGCINALSKRVARDANGNDLVRSVDNPLMHNAVAFTQSIRISKQTAKAFNDYAKSLWESLPEKKQQQTIIASANHVDGTMSASTRNELIQWLKNAPGRDSDDNECRILCNVRCLSEGVDVPSLDAVIFMSQRNSPVDVVQSVGRVMRKSTGKKYGYIIIPVVIPADADPNTVFDDGEKYKVIWTVLNALRAHDDRLNAYINKLQLNNDRGTGGGGIIIGGGDGDDGEGVITGGGGRTDIATQLVLFNEQIQDALYAKLITKLGTKRYWTQWAQDVAKIAQKHIERIKELIDKDKDYATAFAMYLDGLHKNINPSVTADEAMQMLAQHLITKPVFDALFENYLFVENNPISLAMKNLLDLVDETGYEADQSTLKEFYKSVRSRCEGIDNASAKQKIIIELYDTFFKTAMPTTVDKLGIVYTPVEVVDFINQSVADVLKKEFRRNISDANVHIIDPFTGTGTFITRMIQSGLIRPGDLPRKYAQELHANEIVLLAYYIASINIENAYHDAVGQKQGEYTPFEGICLTDTFQMYETVKSMKDLKDGDEWNKNVNTDIFDQNSKRVMRQIKQPIQVIVGNPPYSVGQKSANDNAQNNSYPKLEERIEETYAKEGQASSKKGLYDTYIKAFRWASDRLDATNGGVIGFVTNSGWIDKISLNGLRKCFAKEFTSIYVYNLRGAIRGKSGDIAKREGQNVFDIMTGVAVVILVRNPKIKTGQADIYYSDIGDYLSRKNKLDKIAKMKSVVSKDFVQKILQPDEHGDWLSQRSNVFSNYIQINSEVKFDEKSKSIFNVYSLGLNTNRDVWAYNFCERNAKDNLVLMRDNYNEQVKTVKDEKELNRNSQYISWSSSLLAQWQRKNIVKSNPEMLYAMYRPFCKQNLAWIDEFIHRKGQFKEFFPTVESQNFLICVSGVGYRKEYGVLITNRIPDLEIVEKSQCFPMYWYEENTDEGGQVDMFAEGVKEKYIRHDGITDWIWHQAQGKYGKEVTKEDIFYYVYGLLHSPEYRTQFAADLKKMLPRLPLLERKEDFVAFSQAGRQLAELHLHYENRKPPETVKVEMIKENYQVEKMRFPDKKDKAVIEYNKDITIKNIPLEAYEYVVNGRSAIEWIIERYRIMQDKDSGITNDPNDWAKEHGQPRYILDLLLSIITVSLETMKIVKALPKVRFE